MKSLSIATALLGCLSTALANTGPKTYRTSKYIQPYFFEPEPVFQNNNLVHIISVEKNYAREQVNIAIENISDGPQDEYYVPFTSEQIARIGGFVARDRKDTNAPPYMSDLVEFDPSSNIQYYRVLLPTPLKKGGQLTISLNYYVLKAFRPLPASIKQEEQQYLVYDFSLYFPSAYPTLKQKTDIKSSSADIPDYTKIAGEGDVKEFPTKQGAKLTYGPFGKQPAGAVSMAQVRFEFTKPLLHVSHLERDVEVSHWGGNIAFEERYTLYNHGANLSTLFNRVKWAQTQYFNPATSALKELRVPLQVDSVDPYFTDVIGNVSTSRFRSSKREALLELKPRYPVFGGWKYPFTIGWNTHAANMLRADKGGYVLKVPFLEGPKQAEGIEYGQVSFRVILPEGSSNVRFYTDVPQTAIVETIVDVHKTYLDTIGRTSIVIKAENLVDDFRDREVIIAYDTPLPATLRKPLVIFSSALTLYAATWLLSKIPVGFSSE